MPEIRQNIATKQWVIIATERARRPEEFDRPGRTLTGSRPPYVATCPFCKGNEDQTPPEILRVPAEGDWQVRIVPNKFPALTPEGERVRHFDGIHRWMSGVGRHEVIVEGPVHNRCAALQTDAEVARTLAALQLRGREISQDERIEHINYFANHGAGAGTSLEHPHAQLIALPIVPHNIRRRMEEAQRYLDDTGDCVHCKIWCDEVAEQTRIIHQSEHFVSFVPYAAFSPFHTWIIPKKHRSSFLEADQDELADLGGHVRLVLFKLYAGLHDPDYNYVIRSAPPGLSTEYLHWYVTIVPRVSQAAGFELGSGMYINTALPEESARFLRGVPLD